MRYSLREGDQECGNQGESVTVDNRVGGPRGPADRPGTAYQSFSRNSDLQFRRLLEKLPAGAYTCGPEGLITYFNQHAVQLWGRAPKLNDPEDRFCGSFKLYATDGSPIAHDRCWMALALGMNEEYNEREIVVERPDGQRNTVLAHANPIHDESGQLTGAVNVLVDISDRKRAEEALREVRKYERRRIARDLHDGVLQDLAYAVRTLEMTKLDAEGTGLEEGMQEGIHTIQRAVQELRGTVYDQHIGDEEDRPFPDLLESLVERNRGMARGYEIGLEVEQGFASSLGETGTELLRIVQEALTNARRHSEAGRVVVSLSADDGYMVVEVTDDGRGFGQESTSGMGLMSMRERAIGLAGKLEVESKPGDGTRVRFLVRMPDLLRGTSRSMRPGGDMAEDEGSRTLPHLT